MTTSGTDIANPGASGALTWSGLTYIYARRSNNEVWYRTTDGLNYSGWTSLGGITYNYPAVARTLGNSSGDFINVFSRGSDNNLYVRRSTDGVNYAGWSSLGGIMTGAPSAASIYGRMHVFMRGSDNQLYSKYSYDGINFSDWLVLGGILTSAPVATRDNRVLTVFARGSDNRLYYRQSGDGTTVGSWSGWAPWRNTVLTGPGDQADFPVVADVGVNFIETGHWTDYQLPAYGDMNPQLARFSMFYDNTYPTPQFGTSHINDAIGKGAVTVIFRTAESHIQDYQVDQQLNTVLLNGGQTILQYVAAHPSTNFWIEVGNETNLHGLSPWDARYYMLTTIKNTASKYRASYPNLRWMASMPTKDGIVGDPNHPDWQGLNYLVILLSDAGDGLGTIGSGPYQYDAIGAHVYGDNTLQQSYPISGHAITDVYACPTNNGDDKCPNLVLDSVLSRTALPVFVTESGINSTDPWTTKTTLYVQAMYRMPSRIKGWTIFTLSESAQWYSTTHYAVDVNTSGVVDTNFSGSKVIGQR